MNRPIRLSQPSIAGRELEYLGEALSQGYLAGNGPFSKRCEAWLSSHLNNAPAYLTHSATAALELAALLSGVGAGDEVIMPAFTFVSCANAVALRGATPVFVDIRPDTLNIDAEAAQAAVTQRTRAILMVHYAGIPCDVDAIAAVAKRHGLLMIEDAAQALMSSYKQRPAGALGDFGVFSFHDTKNITCGEGGALVLNARSLAERADIAWCKGTDRRAFDRGEISRYTWIDLGSSFAPNELSAAMLLAQLEQAEAITRRRRALWERYHSAFAGLEEGGLARRPVVPAETEHNGHIYYLLLPDETVRDRFISEMASRGIATPFHFIPLHDSPGGRRFSRAADDLPVTNWAARRLVRLPLWPGLEDRQDAVIDAVHAALDKAAKNR